MMRGCFCYVVCGIYFLPYLCLSVKKIVGLENHRLKIVGLKIVGRNFSHSLIITIEYKGVKNFSRQKFWSESLSADFFFTDKVNLFL